MKKIRCLLVGLFVLGLFFVDSTYALKFSDLLGYNMNDFEISSKNSIGVKQSLCKFDDSTVGGAVLPTIPITKAQGGFSNYSNSTNWYRSVGVRWTVNGGVITFELYDYDRNTWYSVGYPAGGINYTFTDGTTALLDNVYFYYNSVVLFDDNRTHSLQLINEYAIEDLIIFVDFLQNTFDNNIDNFYLIDFRNNKAWSTFLSNTGTINDLFFGRLENYSPSYFYNLDYDRSYTLYEVSNTPWIPNNSNIRSKLSTSCYSFYQQNDTGFTYSLDSTLIPPIFDNGGGSSGSSGHYVDSDLTAWNDYQFCERDYSFRNFIIDNKTACNNDFQNELISFDGRNTVFDYVFNYSDIWTATTGEKAEIFSGINLSMANGCYGLVGNAESLASLYKTQNKPYSDFQSVMGEIKYMSRGSKYDITAKCGSRPSVPVQYQPITNESQVCNFDSWSNIINCFSFGSSSTGTGDETYFSLAVANIRSLISDTFLSNLVSPITEKYNEGKSLISGGLQCDINNNLLVIPGIDYIIWSLALIIFLFLFALI